MYALSFTIQSFVMRPCFPSLTPFVIGSEERHLLLVFGENGVRSQTVVLSCGEFSLSDDKCQRDMGCWYELASSARVTDRGRMPFDRLQESLLC